MRLKVLFTIAALVSATLQANAGSLSKPTQNSVAASRMRVADGGKQQTVTCRLPNGQTKCMGFISCQQIYGGVVGAPCN